MRFIFFKRILNYFNIDFDIDFKMKIAFITRF